VGWDNYPVLNPLKGHEYFGGESVQQTLLAKAFRDLGYSVSMVDRDFGQPDGEVVDGVTVWKMMKEGDGFPGLRFFHPRLTSIHRALSKANADIYFQSCGGFMTGVAAWFCRRNNRKLVFRVAHDRDCIPGRHILSRVYWRDSMMYHYGLRRAHVIAAQTEMQKRLLKRHFGLASEVIDMAVEQPGRHPAAERDIDVLWVNNIRAFKRPDVALEVARHLPQYRFAMIGGPVPGSEDLYAHVQELCDKTENVVSLGQVPYSRVNSYFSRAKILINTSESEGFPNSFLQAWIRGVPVVSFFDPNGFIAKHALGVVPDGVESMVQSLRTLLGDSAQRETLSVNATAYAQKNYSSHQVAQRYIELFERI